MAGILLTTETQHHKSGKLLTLNKMMLNKTGTDDYGYLPS